jgi:hypothetical protein
VKSCAFAAKTVLAAHWLLSEVPHDPCSNRPFDQLAAFWLPRHEWMLVPQLGVETDR